MTYVNVGAWVSATRPRTKKALREALAITPWTVTFDQTSMFTAPGQPDVSKLTVGAIPTGVTLTVTGPDPYTDRKWYASVFLKDGRVVVK